MSHDTYPNSVLLLINGQWVQGSGGISEPIFNPSTGATLGSVQHASADDLDQALASSAAGFEIWRTTPAVQRQQVIDKAVALLNERADKIATILTLEQGKPLAEAYQELGASVAVLKWFGEEGKRTYGRQVPSRSPNLRQTVVREPVGPALAFVAWNFPALNFMRKVGGALAAGCSIIIKPSEETPATATAIAQAFCDAGLPPGVLNVVFGVPADVSAHLLASEIPRKLSFTGSAPVGQHLQTLAAQTLKRCTLELGGHGPVLIFGDSDIDAAAAASVASKFRNAGQVCVSPTRFIVQASVYDEFVARFVTHASALKIGDGLAADTQMGPLASERRIAAAQGFVQDAVFKGAELLCGGERISNEGHFFTPTVLADVPMSARIMHEEPFGPVAPIVPFDTLDEALTEANRLPFGLAAYAFTSDQCKSAAIAGGINAGMLGLNSFNIASPETPFGGVNHSGYGSEGGIEGVEAFLRTKSITETV